MTFFSFFHAERRKASLWLIATRSLTAPILLLAIAADCAASSDERARHSHIQFIASTGSVDIEMTSKAWGSTRLRVPQQYLSSGPVGTLVSRLERLELEVAMPDMRPRKAQVPLRGERGSAEWIQSLEENRAGLWVIALPRQSAAAFYETMARLFSTRYKRTDDGQFDLTLYRMERCSPGRRQVEQNKSAATSCYTAPEEFFLSPRFPDGNAVRFDCLPEAAGVLSGCTALTTIGKLDLEYRFRRSELKRWREIDLLVRQFVSGLIVE